MARLRMDALLEYAEHEGEAAFLSELRRMEMVPSPVTLCEGRMEAEEAVVYAVALRSLGWVQAAEEVMEAVVGAALRRSVRNWGTVAAEA